MTQQHTVADLMTADVITVSEEDSLESLLEGMESLRVRHLPVVDGRRLVGLITQRDLLRLSGGELDPSPVAAARRARSAAEAFVAEVMTRDPLTARPETSLADAARALVEGRFGCLPVVDAGKTLVGIVTAHDLLQWIVDQALIDGPHETAPGTEVRALSLPPPPPPPPREA